MARTDSQIRRMFEVQKLRHQEPEMCRRLAALSRADLSHFLMSLMVVVEERPETTLLDILLLLEDEGLHAVKFAKDWLTVTANAEIEWRAERDAARDAVREKLFGNELGAARAELQRELATDQLNASHKKFPTLFDHIETDREMPDDPSWQRQILAALDAGESEVLTSACTERRFTRAETEPGHRLAGFVNDEKHSFEEEELVYVGPPPIRDIAIEVTIDDEHSDGIPSEVVR